MAIEFRDYYTILGVSRSAGDEDIRKAFRRLARQYHPDANGNDDLAEDRFKEINEAYEVLGDPERRKKYDDFTLHWPRGEDWAFPPEWEASVGQSQGGKAEHFTFTPNGFSEFFQQLFGPNAVPPSLSGERPEPRSAEIFEESRGNKGDDLETDLVVTLEEVAKGAVRPVTMRHASRCQTCFGMGQYNAHPCEKCNGRGSVIQPSSFQVKVPVGIPEGACLRVPGQGEQGLVGGPGDLYLKIRYAPHPALQLEDGQLIHHLNIPPWEAVLGTTATIPTLEGKVDIKIPPGTQNGFKLRLKKRGMPQLNGTVGDLIVHVKVQVPTVTKERQRQLWEELARETAR